MQTLYTHKDSNIRKTWLMFTLFFLIVIGVGWIFSNVYGNSTILYIAVIFSVVMNITSYWFSDKLVLKMTRARVADEKEYAELHRIVENLSITAGLPKPALYVVDDPAPNAFATGRNPAHAVVAVTTGIMARLERSELEGVLAHEMSHIGNRDMLVSTVAVVLVGFLALLSDFFMRSLLWGGGRRSSSDRGGSPIVLIVAIAAAILAPIAASLMQLAISRKREFLADASGALLTRYPEGLASALEKISSDPNKLRVANNTMAHLWFENPFKGDKNRSKPSWVVKLFMTHPPVEERVQALRGLRVP